MKYNIHIYIARGLYIYDFWVYRVPSKNMDSYVNDTFYSLVETYAI